MTKIVLVGCLLFAACTTVVMESSSEVRPSRYAIIEFTQQLAAQDSAVAYAKRALAAEQISLVRAETQGPIVTGGPVAFAADSTLPKLDARVTISATTTGTATKFRIYATSVLNAGEVGGVDARLLALTQRLARRIESMINP